MQQTSQSFNYLIISDLHLQEAEQTSGGRLFYFDQEFTDFLRYYRSSYEGERRWRLIIAGDFIEFYHRMDEQPDPNDKLLKGVELTQNDLKFILGTECQKSVWKLDRIAKSHQLLFIALARFIVEGNEIYLMRGNHDLEFFWPEVQNHFCLLLAQSHPIEISYFEMKTLVQERVRFVPWFYLEQDLLFVEHGHQYDSYCSNAHNLYPVLPSNHQVLEIALSAFTIRYFVSRIKNVEPAALETINSIPKYLGHMIRNNPRQLLQMPIYCMEMIFRTLTKARKVPSVVEETIRQMEAKIREDIQASYGLPDNTCNSIEQLSHLPVLRQRWETIKCFGLDLALIALGSFTAGLGIWLTTSHSSEIWGSLFLSLLVVLPLLYVGRTRVNRFNDHRNLRKIAQKIRDAVGCRYVVFGHSHDPDVYPLSKTQDHWYFNVGTWIPRSKERQFVYLAILKDPTGPSAHLLRWDREHAQPLEMDLASYAKGSPKRKAMMAGEQSGAR